MTRLFDHDDWSRFDSPEANAPSFLSDSFDPGPFEPMRDTVVVTARERDISPSSANVGDVLEPSHDDARSASAARELPAPVVAPSSPYGWYSDWTTRTSTSYPQENQYDAGIDLRPDTRYATYEPYRPTVQDSWDPLTDPWPADKRLAETRSPGLADVRPWSPEPPVPATRYADDRALEPRRADRSHSSTPSHELPTYEGYSPQSSYQPNAQNLVFPEAGYSEAQYVETRYVETQYVETAYVEKQYVESRPAESQLPSWLRDVSPSVPTQSRVDEPLTALPAISAAPSASYLPAQYSVPEPEPRSTDPQDYDVVLPGPLGDLEIGFRDANWYSLSSAAPRRLRIRGVLASHPQHAGSIVQVVCWWMRENAGSVRAVDLASELALAVSDFARVGTGVRRAG